MATRSRSLLFLNFRNSFNRSNKQRVDEHSEYAGLIQEQGEVVVEMSALPPKWMDAVQHIEENIGHLREKMQQLESLYKKNTLPGFKDTLNEEQSIERLTEEMQRLFKTTQNMIKNIYQRRKDETALNKNIQMSLAAKLQELSSQFRKTQSRYLNKLRQRDAKGGPTQFHQGTKEDEDLDSVFTDAQLQAVASNEAAITQREQEINQIAKSILGLAEIFKELNTMVIDQGSVLDRIDYNIEQTNVHLESAHNELIKGAEYQKNAHSIAKYCITFLAICVGIMFIVLIWKFSKRK
ncbi:t-SNARE [Gorgonomyces haynaldii]|nr:t-SNARE [Gorgonomyces haynaldii]